ncbi:hypothetical protein B0J14DRAFT_640117 [Halenospora varia]|nr:hypothetical protein B0J14DRAFT_640117 [Halenospora varia]
MSQALSLSASAEKDHQSPDSPHPNKFLAALARDSPVIKNLEVLVTFLVGSTTSPKRFIVHKDVACSASPIFNATFNSGFEEGPTLTYELEDTTPAVFTLLNDWMYRHEINLGTCHQKCTTDQHHQAITLELCELWILADRLFIPCLRSYVVGILFDMIEVGQTGPFN